MACRGQRQPTSRLSKRRMQISLNPTPLATIQISRTTRRWPYGLILGLHETFEDDGTDRHSQYARLLGDLGAAEAGRQSRLALD